MYIKYKNADGETLFEPVCLSFVPNYATVFLDTYAIVNGCEKEDTRTLCKRVKQAYLNNEFDIVDYSNINDGLVMIGNELFYTPKQMFTFIYLFEKALYNNEAVFDVSSLTVDKLNSYIPMVTKEEQIPSVQDYSEVFIEGV